MSFDTHSNLAYSLIQTVVSQTSTTIIFTVLTGHGTRFATNQQITIWPGSQAAALLDNSMICRITGISEDQITANIQASSLEGTLVRTIKVGDQVANTPTKKVLTDIESVVNTNTTNIASQTTELATHASEIATNTTSITTLNGKFPITTSEIADANVTSRKMKLDQIQTAISTTDLASGSTTYIDYTGLSITFTPNVASNLLVLLQINSNNGANSGVNDFVILLDTVIQGQDPLITLVTPTASGPSLTTTLFGFLWITGVSAAAHTIKVQAKNGVGGGTVHTIYGSLTVIPFAS